eukprot:2079333-Rhodomonas_salina.3
MVQNFQGDLEQGYQVITNLFNYELTTVVNNTKDDNLRPSTSDMGSRVHVLRQSSLQGNADVECVPGWLIRLWRKQCTRVPGDRDAWGVR